MGYWLFKSEPDEYSLDDLRREPSSIGRWDGIRNYQARNFLRDEVKVGDGVLFYHSSCKPTGIAGLAEVVRPAYPDPLACDPDSDYFDAKSSPENPRWFAVDIRFVKAFPRLLTLTELRARPDLADMRLLQRGSRLSVMPVSEKEWQVVNALAEQR